jgi:hypothetical protein
MVFTTCEDIASEVKKENVAQEQRDAKMSINP